MNTPAVDRWRCFSSNFAILTEHNRTDGYTVLPQNVFIYSSLLLLFLHFIIGFQYINNYKLLNI